MSQGPIDAQDPIANNDLPLKLVCKTGVVYTFSHDEYPTFEQRKGRVQDEQRIKKHFSEKFSYRVFEPFVNLTADGVRTKAEEIAKSEYLNNANIMVIFIISQFDEVGKYLAKEDYFTEDEVIQFFLNSPALVHKAKLFIFQASRASEKKSADNDSDIYDGASTGSTFYSLPEETNMFVVRSSLSFSLTNGGTWFIDEICNKLIGRLPLQQEISNVINEAKYMISSNKGCISILPPVVTSTLIQTVFLNRTNKANTEEHKLASYDRAKKNGILYIFNYNETMNNLRCRYDYREGTMYDVLKMKETFEELHFEVIVKHDLKSEELKDELDLSTRFKKGRKHMCIIVAVFTHGYEGKLGTADDPIDCMDLYKKVCEQEVLKDIPKIFILQVCRGRDISRAVEFKGIVEVKNEDIVGFDRSLAADDSRVSVGSSENNMVKNNPMLKFEDMIVLHSAYQGTKAWREREYGSWLIQKLCETMKEKTMCNPASLVDIFTEVQREVALLKIGTNKQMPVYTSTLTKDVIIGKRK